MIGPQSGIYHLRDRTKPVYSHFHHILHNKIVSIDGTVKDGFLAAKHMLFSKYDMIKGLHIRQKRRNCSFKEFSQLHMRYVLEPQRHEALSSSVIAAAIAYLIDPM